MTAILSCDRSVKIVTNIIYPHVRANLLFEKLPQNLYESKIHYLGSEPETFHLQSPTIIYQLTL